MGRKKLIMILALTILLGLTMSVWAQEAGLIPVPVFTGAGVQAVVTYDTTTALYTYSYTITNPATNTGEIWDIDIDISQPPNSVNLSSDGLIIPHGFITDTFAENLEDFKGDFVSMIPVGIQVPIGWGGTLGTSGVAGISSGTGTSNILPGETKEGFELISRGLPTIRRIEIEPWWIFSKEGAITNDDEDLGREITESLTFRTKTIAPTAPPKFFNPNTFLDMINGYINESVTLGWLIDSTLVSTLQTELDTARSFIEANDPSSAKAALGRFMTSLDGSSSTQRTTDVYGLLFFNTQYLYEQLAETYIPPVPGLELAPEEASLPIGTYHTLNSTFMLDSTPTSLGYTPVKLVVIEGPNAGLEMEKTNPFGPTVSFSYTSTLVGTDHLETRLEGEVGGAWVTSPPVKVTWTGGPDLVIELFIPPIIKTKGGEQITITEITGNVGNTPAWESITRYYLSDKPEFDPISEEVMVIGERIVSPLEPGMSGDGGSQIFVLPEGLSEGTYFMKACADADKAMTELDEQNNCEANQIAIAMELSPNQPPDCTQALPGMDSLWPPNHKLVTISINGVTDPDGDEITLTITGITQDEPVNGLGDGDTSPDGFGVGTDQAQIRAERSGTGNGRVYAISFKAEDGKGSACTDHVTVGVPHDQGKGKIPVDDGQNFDSTQP